MLPASLHLFGWNAVHSAMDVVPLVIYPKSRELSFEVKLVPEMYLVQKVYANRSDHSLSEGMRDRNVRINFTSSMSITRRLVSSISIFAIEPESASILSTCHSPLPA